MILMAIWHVSWVWKALPRRAVPFAIVAVLPSFFNSWLLNHFSWVYFYKKMGKDDSLPMFWQAMVYINNNNNNEHT